MSRDLPGSLDDPRVSVRVADVGRGDPFQFVSF